LNIQGSLETVRKECPLNVTSNSTVNSKNKIKYDPIIGSILWLQNIFGVSKVLTNPSQLIVKSIITCYSVHQYNNLKSFHHIKKLHTF